MFLRQLGYKQLQCLDELPLWYSKSLLSCLITSRVENLGLSILPTGAHLQSLRVEVLNVPVESSFWERSSWADLCAILCPGGHGHQGSGSFFEVRSSASYRCLIWIRNAQGRNLQHQGCHKKKGNGRRHRACGYAPNVSAIAGSG